MKLWGNGLHAIELIEMTVKSTSVMRKCNSNEILTDLGRYFTTVKIDFVDSSLFGDFIQS